MIHGKDCILQAMVGREWNPETIAAAKDLDIDRKTDTIEVCSPEDGPETDYIAGTTSWSASTGGLCAKEENVNRLRQIWRDRKKVTLFYKVGSMIEKGSAIMTSLKESGNLGNLMKFSASFQGCGKLEELKPYVGSWNTYSDSDTLYIDADGALMMKHGDGILYMEIDTNYSFPIRLTIQKKFIPLIVVCDGILEDITDLLDDGDTQTIQEDKMEYLIDCEDYTTTTINLHPGHYVLLASENIAHKIALNTKVEVVYS